MNRYGESMTSADAAASPLDPAADVAIVVTGHREGALAHRTFRALARAIDTAIEAGVRVEVVGVLDTADDATVEIFEDALGEQGVVGSLVPARTVKVTHGDPGASRNHGVSETRAAWVCVLDADNLPSGSWIRDAFRTATAYGGACVVHAENLVIFQGRWEMWPQLPTDHPGFRAENFFDRNFWDTFCLAAREVFEQIPYAPTARHSGFGPEDWHWAMETTQSQVPHLAAADTALFYRVKSTGSVQVGHDTERSLLPPARLLTDKVMAASAGQDNGSGSRPRGLQRQIIRERGGRLALPPLPDLVPASDLPLARRRRFVWPDHYRFLRPDSADLTDEEVRARFTQRQFRERGWLRDQELAALGSPDFNVLHYRALTPEALRMSNEDAMVHYLDVGRHSGARARLTTDELDDIARLELDDYQALHADLEHHGVPELVNHYLLHGRVEGRAGAMTAEQRQARRTVVVSPGLAGEMQALHEIEPAIPVPSTQHLERLRYIGPPEDGSLTPGSRVWWKLVAQLGSIRPDVVFLTPWIRMGGGDILLARYANAAGRLRPDDTVVVISTHGESTRPDWLDAGITFVDLPSMPEWKQLTPGERSRLLATLVVQYRPDVVHAFNSPEFFDAVEHYPRALHASTTVYLSTFVIDRDADGGMANHLFHRPADYLSVVAGVVVDNHALVEQFHDLYRFPREKFRVHHQPVVLPPARERPRRALDAPLRVMWAARFDKQKRLDVLADVAEAAARSGVPIEWHVYGAPVMGSDVSTRLHIERLEARGATFHGTYSSFASLPLDETDLFLLTSESEGIPLTLLDVLAHRVPVMAPLVGGIPELVDSGTGWPIERFDDIDAYVDALRVVAGDPDEAVRRADAGHDLLAREFSWEHFDGLLRALPGYVPD